MRHVQSHESQFTGMRQNWKKSARNFDILVLALRHRSAWPRFSSHGPVTSPVVLFHLKVSARISTSACGRRLNRGCPTKHSSIDVDAQALTGVLGFPCGSETLM